MTIGILKSILQISCFVKPTVRNPPIFSLQKISRDSQMRNCNKVKFSLKMTLNDGLIIWVVVDKWCRLTELFLTLEWSTLYLLLHCALFPSINSTFSRLSVTEVVSLLPSLALCQMYQCLFLSNSVSHSCRSVSGAVLLSIHVAL